MPEPAGYCQTFNAFTEGETRIPRSRTPLLLWRRSLPVPQGLLPLFGGLAAISRASAPIVCGRSAANAAPRDLCDVVKTLDNLDFVDWKRKTR